MSKNINLTLELNKRRQTIENRINSCNMSLIELDIDEVDRAKSEALRLKTIRQVELDKETCRAISRALIRIEQGIYGTCITCGEDILHQRLVIFPEAAQCFECQREYEIKSKHMIFNK